MGLFKVATTTENWTNILKIILMKTPQLSGSQKKQQFWFEAWSQCVLTLDKKVMQKIRAIYKFIISINADNKPMVMNFKVPTVCHFNCFSFLISNIANPHIHVHVLHSLSPTGQLNLVQMIKLGEDSKRFWNSNNSVASFILTKPHWPWEKKYFFNMQRWSCTKNCFYFSSKNRKNKSDSVLIGGS